MRKLQAMEIKHLETTPLWKITKVEKQEAR